jgi:predicted  nucleic acid-binding Zn-ribbon protein
VERQLPDLVFSLVEVRCLGCGEVYAKPVGGGTVRANPGCPECSYVGWGHTTEMSTPASSRHRFAEGRLRRRSA